MTNNNNKSPTDDDQFNPQSSSQRQHRMKEFIYYKCTPEESRVFEKCEQDALIRRSIPFAIGFGVGTFFGIRKGYLKANVRFGPWPKVIGASALGYIIGKLSYMDECEERIMALPNSRLAQMLLSGSQKYNNNYSHFDEIKETNATQDGMKTVTSFAPLQLDQFNQPNFSTFRPYGDSVSTKEDFDVRRKKSIQFERRPFGKGN